MNVRVGINIKRLPNLLLQLKFVKEKLRRVLDGGRNCYNAKNGRHELQILLLENQGFTAEDLEALAVAVSNEDYLDGRCSF